MAGVSLLDLHDENAWFRKLIDVEDLFNAMLLQPLDGIATRPAVGFVGDSILCRIIACRMRVAPVGNQLNKRRAAAASRSLDGP